MVESVSTIFEDLFDSSPVKVAHGDEIIANAEVVRVEESNPSRVTPKRKYKSIQHVKSLYDDLNDRIREDSQTHEVLLEAENKSYSQSGHTSFNYSAEEYHKNSNFVSANPNPIVQPSKISRLRPAPINVASFKEDHRNEYQFYLANCPEHWETKGIDSVLSKAPESARIHIQNISSASAINKVRQAYPTFKNLSCEVAASHLYFSSKSIEKADTRFKSIPPIRNHTNLNFLWEIMHLRGISTVTSQHTFIKRDHKVLGSGSFSNALNGICSIVFSLRRFGLL